MKLMKTFRTRMHETNETFRTYRKPSAEHCSEHINKMDLLASHSELKTLSIEGGHTLHSNVLHNTLEGGLSIFYQ